MHKSLYIIVILTLVGCQTKSNQLFWIDKNSQHKNDFLYMAESTNIKKLSADSAHYFLTNSEILEMRLLESNLHSDTISSATPNFKKFGKIHQSEKFDLHVLLRDESGEKGRDYQFILRSYNKEFKIIDSYTLASWIEAKEEYCFCEIDINLLITKICDHNKSEEKIAINDFGVFERFTKLNE